MKNALEKHTNPYIVYIVTAFNHLNITRDYNFLHINTSLL